MLEAKMRPTDIVLFAAAIGALALAVEGRNRTDISAHDVKPEHSNLITCPMRQPDFATVMHAAFVGDGTLIVEQQTSTRVRHIKDC
jgi:hypothetical protein